MANWRVGGVYRAKHTELYRPGRVPVFVIKSIGENGARINFVHRFEGEADEWGGVSTLIFDTLAWPEDISFGDAAIELVRRIAVVGYQNSEKEYYAALQKIVDDARKLLAANDSVEAKADAGS